MKVRKVMAGGLAVAAAGATLAFGALAASTSLGDFVRVGADKASISSPLIVIGAPASVSNPAYANDVLGAADIAAAVAGYATTQISVGGGATISVTEDGADLSTTNTKIFYGDTLTKSGLRSTMTVNNLPTLLAAGTFYDASGNAFSFSQYLNFGAGTVTFGTSGGDLTDPKLYIDTGTSTATPLFNMSVTFNKLLNLSSADVRGQIITLFGKEFTIGSASEFSSGTKKLVLFGGAGNSQTLAEGQEQEVTINGVKHTVKVIGVSSSTIAVIAVDGQSKSVTKGNTYTIQGVDVYIDDIYSFTKESQLSQVKLSLGSNKLTMVNGDAVKVGQSEDSIDGTLVTLTGTADQGISKLDISVTSKDTSFDYIASGAAFQDPVFNAVKVAFGGLNSGTVDKITVDNSGTTGANMKFTDYRGNEKSIIWSYTSSTSYGPQLNDSSTRAYHVLEKETVPKNDYILMAPSQESEFGHIMQYTTASSIGSSGAYIELKDVVSGDSSRIYLTSSNGNTANAAATFYVDGQQYFVNVTDVANQKIQFTWGANAAIGVDGDKVMAFPLIKTKNGEYVTLLKSMLFANDTYDLPGNASATINGCATTVSAGRLTYTFAGGCLPTGATLTAINKTGSVGVDLVSAPAILIYEQKGKDTGDIDVKDAILVGLTNGGTSGAPEIKISQPVLTAETNSGFVAQSSDPSVSEAYDRFGAHITYDSDSQGLATITIPQDQASAMAGAGSDPKFSTSGAGGTYNAAVQIKSPISKLASEIATPASLTSDIIILGGPCANSLAATLLSSEAIPVTCENWAYTTGIIKEVENAFGSGRKALIVAGTQGTDTRALAARVMQGTLAFSQ